jgi:nucleoside 2-deoxyribosyltransferase
MIVAFTGHRNRTASQNELEHIITQLSPNLCIHGGACGFDTSAGNCATKMGVPVIQYLPNYRKYGSGATFMRNRAMIELCDAVVACYDGRETGGTFYTIRYARELNKPIYILP